MRRGDEARGARGEKYGEGDERAAAVCQLHFIVMGHEGKRSGNGRLTSSVSPGTWMMPSYRGGDLDVKMELTK